MRLPIAAAVIVNDGRVLLVRRRVAEGRLSWQFPADKVEAGESDAIAAVRETFEEAGLVVRAFRHLGERIHPDTGRVVRYVACEVIDGAAFAADIDEISDIAWSGRAALATYVPYPLYRPVQDYLDGSLR